MYYIDMKGVGNKHCGRFILKNGKIIVEADTEDLKEELRQDIELWKKNWKHRGLDDEEKLFWKIPIITSYWSMVWVTNPKELK